MGSTQPLVGADHPGDPAANGAQPALRRPSRPVRADAVAGESGALCRVHRSCEPMGTQQRRSGDPGDDGAVAADVVGRRQPAGRQAEDAAEVGGVADERGHGRDSGADEPHGPVAPQHCAGRKGEDMTTPPLPVWYPGRSGVPGIAVASLQPQDDPFYSYTGSTPLESITPGTVLNTRRFHYHLFGFPTLLETTPLLYRSTSQTGKPPVNVTSIIAPPIQFDETKVISYQSAYDSLNRNDEPSYAIWGGLRLGGLIPNVEAAVFGP